MKRFLPISKISRIIQSCKNLLQNSNPTIREIAHVAGLIVSALPAVRYLQLHYCSIEFCKSQALLAGRDYDDHSCLDINSWFDLLWIIQNIATFNGKVFQEPEINLFVNSDAGLTGWGASCNGQTTGGRWSLSESNNHINFLELLAAFLALQTFVSQSNIHVRLKLDNTTAVSYINNMGGIRAEPLNTLAKKIWHWCMSREIWLSAQYVPGDLNAEADSASRLFSEDLEWSLHPTIFSELQSTIWSPDIDLFASRLNFKVEKYVSWHPDPGAYAVDAFSLSWSNMGSSTFQSYLSHIGKGAQGQSCGNTNSSYLAHTGLVPSASTFSSATASTLAKVGGSASSTTQPGVPPSEVQDEASRLGCVRKSLSDKGISSQATNLICASWTAGTEKQYQAVWKKWRGWCRERNVDCLQSHVSQVLNFLADCFGEGLSYSTLNSYRSALSSTLCPLLYTHCVPRVLCA